MPTAGYAYVMTQVRIRQEATKPLFGKPKMMYAQCLAMSSYFMQLGAVLGSKHRQKPDAFAHAFLGATQGGMMMELGEMSISNTRLHLSEDSTFLSYVLAEQVSLSESHGGPNQLLIALGSQKVNLISASALIQHYAEAGAILGIKFPEEARSTFERSNPPFEQDLWRKAHAKGLGIPEHPDTITWNEVLEDRDNVIVSVNCSFREYCKKCAPTQYMELFG